MSRVGQNRHVRSKLETFFHVADMSPTCRRHSQLSLWVADTTNASICLRFKLPGESLPVFICLLRDESLSIMNNGQSICKAMQYAHQHSANH
jgi:hypothetical protein